LSNESPVAANLPQPGPIFRRTTQYCRCKDVIGRCFIVDIGGRGAYFQAFASEGRQDEFLGEYLYIRSREKEVGTP